jgi:pimeloyl-ACP methyl ester carboxylesterase
MSTYQTKLFCLVAGALASGAAGCAPDAAESAPSARVAEATASDEFALRGEEATLAPQDDAALGVAEASRAARVAFSPCAEDPELECGQLSVPVDYRRPRGERVALAVVRARATGARTRGALFVNPGGPGGSGVDFVIFAKPLFNALRQDFDIVSFDPRGTGRSAPADCTIQLPPAPPNDSVEALAPFYDTISQRYAQACAEQVGPLATQLGTNNVARDLDVFRAALGEREINYLGYSYGTVLGSSYATLFPHRVRAMVLDGNATPAWFSDYLIELDADGSAGAELALRQLDRLCRGNASCPLRSAGVVATYDRLVERLNRNPVQVGQAVITGQSVTFLVFGALYNEQQGWPFIATALARADAGDLRALPALSANDAPALTIPSTFAIVCDDSKSRRPGLDYLPSLLGTTEVYPRFGGVNFGFGVTACTAWPRTEIRPLSRLRTRHPVVLLGNDFDPATPLAWSRNMASTLGDRAQLVRYQGGGHTIYGSGSACIDAAVESYFRDLKTPEQGTVCPQVPLQFQADARAARAPRIADILPRVNPDPAKQPRLR